MKVWFKRILIGIVVLVIAAVVGIAIFLLTFDPNAYKAKLETLVYNRYHRTLSIKGDLELSLFPRIGLSVHDVSLSNSDSDTLFASIDSARFAVAIWPLISNRLVVDHVAVTGFKAWVSRDMKGQFNFHDLLARRKPALRGTHIALAHAGAAAHFGGHGVMGVAHAATLPAIFAVPHAEGADFQIDIAGLDLKNGEIHYYDARTGAALQIAKLDVNTGRVTFAKPFDVSFKGQLIGAKPSAKADIQGQAVVAFNPEARTYSAQKLNVQMKGRLGPLEAKAAALQGNLAYSAFSRLLDISNLDLSVQGKVQPNKLGIPAVENLDASLAIPELKFDAGQSEYRVTKLALRAKGDASAGAFDVAFDAPSLSVSPDSAKGEPVVGTVKLSGNDVLGVSLGLKGIGGNAQHLKFGELSVESSFKKADRLVQVTMSSPGSWNFVEKQGGLSAIKGDVKIEDAALPGGSFAFPMIGSLHADLLKDVLASEINAVLNGSKLDLKVKAKKLEDPKVTFDLTADTLDLNKLLPPVAVQQAAKPKPDQKPESAKKASAPATSKKAGAAAKQAPPSPVVPQPIDLTFLDSADVTGTVNIGELKVRKLRAGKVAMKIRAAQGKLDVSDIAAQLYEGTLKGRLSATSKNNLAAQLSLDGVSLQPLLMALGREGRLAGTGSVSLNLSSTGPTVPAYIAGLNGTVSAQVKNGAIIGINVAQTLREVSQAVKNAISGQTSQVTTKFDGTRQTDFTSLEADLALKQGQGTLKKLDIKAPLLRIRQGKPANIDLVNEKLDVEIRARVVASTKGQGGLEDLNGVTVPVLISGPFDAPGYRVQWKDIGSRAVKQAVQHGLLDLLSDKLGATPPKQTSPEPAAKTETKPKATSTVKSIGNALKGLLGQ
jgi:AsmA protein